MTHDEYIKRRDEIIQKHNNYCFTEVREDMGYSSLYKEDELFSQEQAQQAIDELVLDLLDTNSFVASDDLHNDAYKGQARKIKSLRSIVKGGE